ncbi:MAG: homoserine dehydrogenase, partial [Pseudomonadota bacterium]
MTEPFRVALAGLGTVGTSVFRLIETHAELYAARIGRPLEVVAVSARDRDKQRGIDCTRCVWFDDPVAMAAEAEADCVVELIGGEEGAALELTQVALEQGRHVVTANKALLAHHGSALAKQAETANRALRFEAAVAGGIPIINALQDGLTANRIERVYGILNGTANYILTEMERTGRAFEDVLKEAQELGYAEADPSFDIGGIDAGHKLSLLAALAFGMRVRFDALPMTGITAIEADDIAYARDLGYRIKLLGIAQHTEEGIAQRVEPCLVGAAHPLSPVDGVFNAVVIDADAVDRLTFVGRGAGGEPTASAVLADLIDVARGQVRPAFITPAEKLSDLPLAAVDALPGPFYLRLKVVDRPGVIAAIADRLAR